LNEVTGVSLTDSPALGEKYVFNFLKKQATVITADIEPGFYKIIDPEVIFADATQLPFKDDEFAFVDANFFSIFTLPFIEGDAKTAGSCCCARSHRVRQGADKSGHPFVPIAIGNGIAP